MSGTITHSWNGTVLTITSDSGTSSADLKGDIGVRGPQGAPGIAVAVEESVSSVNGKKGAVELNAADVGALPQDTVIPSIEGLATESYVEQKVLENKVDLTGYATEEYVNSTIPNLEGYATEVYVDRKVTEVQLGGEVDLSSYATKEELSAYYTKEETNALIVTEIPEYTEADYNKVLTCSATGLVWVEQQAAEVLPSAEEGAF